MKIRSIGNLLVLAAVASAIISAPSAASSLLVYTPDGVITLPDISYSGFVSIQYQTGFDGNVIEAVGPVTSPTVAPSEAQRIASANSSERRSTRRVARVSSGGTWSRARA